MLKSNVDEIDQKILKCLITNARMPFLEIARECGISGVTVHQRVKKLELAGVITGSRLEINPKALGYDICAYVNIQISEANRLEEVISELKSIPEVVECNFISGQYSLFVKLFCKDNEQLMTIMFNSINGIKGVSHTEVNIALNQAFERQVDVDPTI